MCVAVVVVILWLAAGIAGARGTTTSDHVATATVTSTASCQGSDTEDSISITVTGTVHPAKLDGCGHQRGERIGVLVPAAFANGTLLEPADAAPGNSSGASHRVAFVLLIVATVVGGAFGYRFFRTAARTAPVARRRPVRAARAVVDEPDEPDEDYHSDIRRPARGHDPEETGVDWFEDSSTHMSPVPPPADLHERSDRS